MEEIDEKTSQAFALERYRYLQSQIKAANEASYRYLNLYQTLTTAVISAGLALFVGYRSWGISAGVAKQGLMGLLILETLIALFTSMLIVAGIATWVDYRKEEAALLNMHVGVGYRDAPTFKNFYRWYETYIITIMLGGTAAIWILAQTKLLPAMT